MPWWGWLLAGIFIGLAWMGTLVVTAPLLSAQLKRISEQETADP